VTSPTPIVRDPNFGRKRISARGRLLFFVVAWAIVLLPFLFWRSTWFGRALTDHEIDQYIRDQQKPRRIQHALVQVSERMGRRDPAVVRWYPDLVKLASSPVEEIRNTDAWIMGQDTSRPEFRQALLGMLNDSSPVVRGNAALSLVRFGDDSGHAQLLEMLQPAKVAAPQSGRVTDLSQPGTAIRQGGTIAKLETTNGAVEVRATIPGRIRSIAVARGTSVQSGNEVATIDPGPAQVWEALRALYLIGRKEDLPLIAPYKANLNNFPDKVRDQAIETEKAIVQRQLK
jgi:biotin carboxyl carrier protein